MGKRYWIMTASAVLILSFPLSVHPEASEKVVPLPLIEVEKILSQWLFDSGFKVSREERERSGVLLRGLKEREVWEVTLRPYSPLASRIQPRYTSSGHLAQDRVAELWTFLESYLKEPPSERKISYEEVPLIIKSKMESVVCIKVIHGMEEIQFTGFGIDPIGVILSTAHDLKDVREMRVYLNDGIVRQGSLIKRDQKRDLILIDIRSRLNSLVSLNQGRTSLRYGERIFAIGCPNHARTFLSGTIEGPLRQVNNLPLYQAEMDIQPGSSGGPVFDREGNLLAMIKGRHRELPSRGFLIPLTTIIEFLKEK